MHPLNMVNIHSYFDITAGYSHPLSLVAASLLRRPANHTQPGQPWNHAKRAEPGPLDHEADDLRPRPGKKSGCVVDIYNIYIYIYIYIIYNIYTYIYIIYNYIYCVCECSMFLQLWNTLSLNWPTVWPFDFFPSIIIKTNGTIWLPSLKMLPIQDEKHRTSFWQK